MEIIRDILTRLLIIRRPKEDNTNFKCQNAEQQLVEMLFLHWDLKCGMIFRIFLPWNRMLKRSRKT